MAGTPASWGPGRLHWHRAPGAMLDERRYRRGMIGASTHRSGAAPDLLIERDEQLAQLEALLNEARAGQGRAVVLRGEAGIGKSALLRAFMRGVRDRATAAFGYCDAVATQRALSPLHDMAPSLGSELDQLLHERSGRVHLQGLLLSRLAAASHVLAFEDVQWADDATLDLLRILTRRIAETRSLILITYRDEPAPPEGVTRLLGMLATNAAAVSIDIPPLSGQAMAELAAGSGIDPSVLHRLTSGNAFFASQVVAAGGTSVPSSVRDLIRSRLVELSSDARHSLEVAAVLGTRTESWLLAALAREALRGIDNAVAAGLVTVADGEVAFRHELTRLAVLDELPAIRAVALHRSALKALQRGGVTDAARLAHHADAAGDGRAVLRYAVPAAHEALAGGAFRAAIAQIHRALRFVRDDAQRVELLEMLGDAQMAIHDGRGADESWSEALSLRERRSDSPQSIGDLMRRLSRAAWWHADGERARRLASDAISILRPGGDTPELAHAYSAWSGQLMVDNRLREAIEWGQRALELAERLDLDDVRSHALNNIGCAEALLGNEAGFTKLERSLEIARHLGSDDHAFRALNNLAANAVTTYQLRRAEAYFDELSRFVDVSEVRSCSIDAGRAEIMLHLGRWDEAEAFARRTVEVEDAEEIDPHDVSAALAVLARLRALRGEAGAGSLIDRAAELIRDAADGPRAYFVLRARIDLAWTTDGLDRLVQPMRAMLDEAVASEDVWMAGDLARWLSLAGIPVETPLRLPLPHRHVLRGDWTAAAVAWEALDAPYEAALARLHAADPAQVRAAHATFVKLGARPAAARAARRLAELGAPVPRGPRSSTGAHPAGLTVREAEIAALLSEGLTNAEIARRLVLSEKTVGHHVSAVLAKLAIRRRAEVGHALARVGS